MLESIKSSVAKCAALCCDVEFIAVDATRTEQSFLTQALKTAIEAGASTVTLSDTAGTMLPTEFADFIAVQYENLPELKNVTLGVCSANTISMADASAIAAISAGAGQISASAYPLELASVANVARILSAKSDTLNAVCGVRTTQLSRLTEQIERLCSSGKKNSLSGISATDDDEVFLTVHDDLNAVSVAIKKLDYDLSDEDVAKVFGAFTEIAEKKEKVGLKELDAIIASSAM